MSDDAPLVVHLDDIEAAPGVPIPMAGTEHAEHFHHFVVAHYIGDTREVGWNCTDCQASDEDPDYQPTY